MSLLGNVIRGARGLQPGELVDDLAYRRAAGSKGGKTSAALKSPEARSAAACHAANVRWARYFRQKGGECHENQLKLIVKA